MTRDTLETLEIDKIVGNGSAMSECEVVVNTDRLQAVLETCSSYWQLQHIHAIDRLSHYHELSSCLGNSSDSLQPVEQQQPTYRLGRMSKPLPDFAKKQANDISLQKTAELKQHTTACFGKYFTGEGLQGRGEIYQHEQETASGTVKSNNQHPLLKLLATPKLPPELAAYLELK